MGNTNAAENLQEEHFISTSRAANDMAPQSGVDHIDHRQDRSADLDFESETAEARTVENTRAANEAQVAHAMNWRTLPPGAIAAIRWNYKINDVEVRRAPNLTEQQGKAIMFLIIRIRDNVARATNRNKGMQKEGKPSFPIIVW